MRITCSLCGAEIQPDEIHRCPRLQIVGPARPARPEFPWAFWNLMIFGALAMAGLVGIVVSLADRCD